MSVRDRDIDVSKIHDAEHLRTLMANARRLGREDIYWKAFGRLCGLEGQSETDPLHRDFARTLAAYEELLERSNYPCFADTAKAFEQRHRAVTSGLGFGKAAYRGFHASNGQQSRGADWRIFAG
jgi:hypothetical protein